MTDTREVARYGSIRILMIAAIVSVVLTAFHQVHEDLPAALRAPTSLLLTPIAVCSGLCYYLGIPLDVYRSIPLQFLANIIFITPTLLLLRIIIRMRRRSRPEP